MRMKFFDPCGLLVENVTTMHRCSEIDAICDCFGSKGSLVRIQHARPLKNTYLPQFLGKSLQFDDLWIACLVPQTPGKAWARLWNPCGVSERSPARGRGLSFYCLDQFKIRQALLLGVA